MKRIDDAGRAGHPAEDQLTPAEHGGTGRSIAPDLSAARRDVLPPHLLPLHVFEARYRAMVIDALERDRKLAVVRLRPGYEASYAGKPPVHAVAGLGEIVSCERLATGRYNILLRGECRVRIEQELPSDTLYRLVRARRLVDAEPAADAGAGAGAHPRRAAAPARGARRARPTCSTPRSPTGKPAGVIADRVAAAVLPDADLRQSLLETLDVTARVTRVADGPRGARPRAEGRARVSVAAAGRCARSPWSSLPSLASAGGGAERGRGSACGSAT